MDCHEGFRLHDWQVDPRQNRVSGPAGEIRLSPRSMDVLVLMAERAGEVVSRDDFSEHIWRPAVVSDHALNRCISELRRALEDSSDSPRFIETIPKRGYRLVAPVEPLDGSARGGSSGQFARGWRGVSLIAAVGVALVIAGGYYLFNDQSGMDGAPDPSLAVLPFEVVGEDSPSQFADGLHHDLLTQLSQIDDLRIISRSSVMRYRDTIRPIPEIGSELSVSWILEGAVQQIGDRIQLNAQLIDATTDSHAWARTYRRELTAENLFAIQADIVRDIAAAMEAHLTQDEQDRLVTVPTQDLEAYELVIRGHTLLPQRTESTMREAAELFRQATDADPDYAEAWAGLSYARILLAYYGFEDPESLLPKARDNARKALELNPDLPFAHMALGTIHMHLDRNGPAALDALQRAHTLSSEHKGWYSWMTAVAGDLERAVALMEELVRQNPFSAAANMSIAFLYLGDRQTDEALEHARKARELSPGYALAWLLEGQALLIQGRHPEAIAAVEQALDFSSAGSEPGYQAWLAAANARAGKNERARELMERIEGSNDAFAMGVAHLGLRQDEAALEALSRNDWDDNQAIMLRFHPFFDPLRNDERYRELIRQLDRMWALAEDSPDDH